jgi:hypothetical protein
LDGDLALSPISMPMFQLTRAQARMILFVLSLLGSENWSSWSETRISG